MHYDPFSRDRFEDHEVAHVPVKNGGEPKFAKMIQFAPERPAKEVELAGHLDERSKRDSIKRGWVPPP